MLTTEGIIKNYMFFMGVALLLFCFLSYADSLNTLSTQQVLEYIEQRNYPLVDIVLLPPFVTNGKPKSDPQHVNYSVLSVMRFAPWIRRIHIYDKDQKESENVHEYWKTHQKLRLVHFHQDLLNYSLTSPFLSECFLVLKPRFLLTNYLFHWQMFIHHYPVVRNCDMGLLPLTRKILNECSFTQLKPAQYFQYAYRYATQNQQILYKNNLDHFFPPCSSQPITTTKYVPVFDEARVRQFFEYEEPHKKRGSPFEIVLIITCHADDDMTYSIDKKYKNIVQIWVHLMTPKATRDSSARLSFLHRMIVAKNVFLEISGSRLHWKADQMGAEVMRRIRQMSQDHNQQEHHHHTEYKVLDVISYKHRDDGDWYENQSNIVANKLAQAYNAPFSIFTQNTATTIEQMSEYERRKRL
jgi:hypothetical protein